MNFIIDPGSSQIASVPCEQNKKTLHKYNNNKPHKALDGLTPMDYIQHAHAA